ncbi:MAG: helix-turn-helix domain-containing protein [Acidimicrobiales bacterium]|nr:helix-turn-helix domain-containing protein [Acidimicrobiales bacterium]
MAAKAAKMGAMQPLPLAPSGSSHVADGVDFSEDAEGNGSVFLWGMAAWCWQAGDPVARRLAAVQLVNSKAARQRQVANVFGVHENSLVRWRSSYEGGGVESLMDDRPGPRGPSKVTESKRHEIARLRSSGLSLVEVAARTDVSTATVRRVTVVVADAEPSQHAIDHNSSDGDPSDSPTGGDLVPLARPVDRSNERVAARFGLIDDAPPVICEGASLPLVGALLILPALAATGLLEIAASVYGARKAAFYSLRSLFCSIVFACLLGEPRAEGVTRISPTDLGRLVGLDRGPEVGTIRRRVEELATAGRADQLLDQLARHHVQSHTEASGIFYVDGHVRAYHGGREVPKAHVARIRLSMPAELDTWVCDANGDGVLVWAATPGASLVGELRTVADRVRSHVGPDAHPTICFDRGGWSPKLFKELELAGFDILTYRKKPAPTEPVGSFAAYVYTDGVGREHHYLLADRRVTIAYEGGKRRFPCRQITRLDPDTGHQTQVLTTRDDEDPAAIAHLMFSRWNQENFFRYMRAHYGLDALDTYATTDDDMSRIVPNPARRTADRTLAEARKSLAVAEASRGQASLAGRHPNGEITRAFADAAAQIEALERAAKAIPARVPLGDARPGSVRLAPERKRIHDAIRMATYNAESALARLVGPHYARADDEARTLLREAFGSPADLQIVGNELHVRLDPLSAPRRTRAIAGLCQELTATKTIYPGTDLILVYSVKEPG